MTDAISILKIFHRRTEHLIFVKLLLSFDYNYKGTNAFILLPGFPTRNVNSLDLFQKLQDLPG